MGVFWANTVAAGPGPGGHQALLPCGRSQETKVPIAVSLCSFTPPVFYIPIPLYLCGDWAWVWDLVSCGLLVLFLMGGERCLAASPTCGHVLTPGALGQGHWGRRWPSRVLAGASAGEFGGARSPGARVQCAAHVWAAGAWRGRWAVAPGSRGASALCLWGLFPGASSAVFWVDA